MLRDEIQGLIKILSDGDVNDIEFRRDLSEIAPTKEIGIMLADEKISPKDLVEILKTY